MMYLMLGLSGLGYHVYMDNFCTLPALFTELLENEFQACGTMGNNCKGPSQSIKLCKKTEFLCHTYIIPHHD